MSDEIYREALPETRLDRVKIQVLCSRCGNNTFTAKKIVTAYPGREAMVGAGMLAHDWFGWEISDMDIVCAVCGGEPKLDVQPMPNSDAQGAGCGGKGAGPGDEKPESGTAASRAGAERQEIC